jgi:hypothetical protein
MGYTENYRYRDTSSFITVVMILCVAHTKIGEHSSPIAGVGLDKKIYMCHGSGTSKIKDN